MDIRRRPQGRVYGGQGSGQNTVFVSIMNLPWNAETCQKKLAWKRELVHKATSVVADRDERRPNANQERISA
jgi:hypothetical protein